MLVASGKACSSAMFDFQKMRSLGTTLMVTSDLCAFSFVFTYKRAFSNRCVFDGNAQRFSVDRRRKLISVDRAL